MSVRDNLIVAAQEHQGTMLGRMFSPSDSGLGARADALIRRFCIEHVANLKAGTLSYGQQKLVDIAMAFMAKPDLVLLDEPCAEWQMKQLRWSRVASCCTSVRMSYWPIQISSDCFWVNTLQKSLDKHQREERGGGGGSPKNILHNPIPFGLSPSKSLS